MTSFSRRFGYGVVSSPAPITVREDAPHEFRGVLVDLAYESGLRPATLRNIVCQVLRVRADPDNWSDFPNIDNEVRDLVDEAPWYRVYDIAEAIHRAVRAGHRAEAGDGFREELNAYFVERGIGWELQDDGLRYRGPEGFETVVKNAQTDVSAHGYLTAANELHQAIADLSRRPEPDRTGAIQHAMASLECIAR
ncbi:AbiJ-NTD4 domain-containing protein, partial [Burkholderia ubonensis]|uniref:AbiJ-NTD4 domain-containing protein n=1 Tax=Burkholderia ubonensis TaxID=101571 RepID=UPI0015A4EFE7